VGEVGRYHAGVITPLATQHPRLSQCRSVIGLFVFPCSNFRNLNCLIPHLTHFKIYKVVGNYPGYRAFLSKKV
jgi:hypothetical protein